MLNIVSNAIDACDKDAGDKATGDWETAGDDTADGERHVGRCVTTCFNRQAGHVAVSVEDNGQGIAAEDMDQIFSLFVSHKGNRGTGLGLPVSQKIVKEHGGRIRVESEVRQGEPFRARIAGAARRNCPYDDDCARRSSGRIEWRAESRKRKLTLGSTASLPGVELGLTNHDDVPMAGAVDAGREPEFEISGLARPRNQSDVAR